MPAGPGPNPVKVAMALEHLGLDYDCIPLVFGEGKGTVKDPEYTSKVNPNGRVPGLIDHENNDFTVFESAAILQYLAEKVPLNPSPLCDIQLTDNPV